MVTWGSQFFVMISPYRLESTLKSYSKNSKPPHDSSLLCRICGDHPSGVQG